MSTSNAISTTHKRALRLDGVALAAALATLVCVAPVLAVLVLAAFGAGDSVSFGAALLRDGAIGTFTLMLAGGGGAIAFGAGAAWLVSLCKFPGRGVFEWLLVIPLAAPSYILAYSYTSLTWAGGLIPYRVEGFWGAAFIYAVGLYPYVYLAARAAFVSQSSCAIEAARMLGANPASVFWRVALPLARPGIAAGGALACSSKNCTFTTSRRGSVSFGTRTGIDHVFVSPGPMRPNTNSRSSYRKLSLLSCAHT